MNEKTHVYARMKKAWPVPEKLLGHTYIKRDKDKAYEEAKSEFSNRFNDIPEGKEKANLEDAFRHLYVSGRLVQMGYSENFVHLLGTGREFPQMLSSPDDANMDRWNNGLGRRIAVASPSKEVLARAAENIIREKIAITSSKDDSRKYEGKTKKPEASKTDDNSLNLSVADMQETEIKKLISSDAYHRYSHMDYSKARQKVTEWYEHHYGNIPVQVDATGRMIKPSLRSSSKRGGPVHVQAYDRAGGKEHVREHMRAAPQRHR